MVAKRSSAIEGYTIKQGERLRVLYTNGEGGFIVRAGEHELDVYPEQIGVKDDEVKKARYEWWACIRNARGQTGWLPMLKTPFLWGVDGCGSGKPPWAK